jgi:hypothetical protein
MQVYVYPTSSGNVFNLSEAEGGGNYWSDWTSPDEDGDGFVDSPYTFDGGEDNLPWTEMNGWLGKMIGNLAGKVFGMNLQAGIENGLDAKLDTALQALEDINENNDVAAINTLEAFINAVEAQRGNKISDTNADDLIAAAQAIINQLNAG